MRRNKTRLEFDQAAQAEIEKNLKQNLTPMSILSKLQIAIFNTPFKPSAFRFFPEKARLTGSKKREQKTIHVSKNTKKILDAIKKLTLPAVSKNEVYVSTAVKISQVIQNRPKSRSDKKQMFYQNLFASLDLDAVWFLHNCKNIYDAELRKKSTNPSDRKFLFALGEIYRDVFLNDDQTVQKILVLFSEERAKQIKHPTHIVHRLYDSVVSNGVRPLSIKKETVKSQFQEYVKLFSEISPDDLKIDNNPKILDTMRDFLAAFDRTIQFALPKNYNDDDRLNLFIYLMQDMKLDQQTVTNLYIVSAIVESSIQGLPSTAYSQELNRQSNLMAALTGAMVQKYMMQERMSSTIKTAFMDSLNKQYHSYESTLTALQYRPK